GFERWGLLPGVARIDQTPLDLAIFGRQVGSCQRIEFGAIARLIFRRKLSEIVRDQSPCLGTTRLIESPNAHCPSSRVATDDEGPHLCGRGTQSSLCDEYSLGEVPRLRSG